MSSNAYVFRHSVIHRLNPAMKFIAFLLLIAMVFLPLGFFAQFFIGAFVLIIFFVAKLPGRMLWNIFKSVLFLFFLLLLINWMTYKDPIAIFNVSQHSVVFGNLEWVKSPGLYVADINHFDKSHEVNNLVSPVWGGEIRTYLNPSFFLSKDFDFDQFLKINELNEQDFYKKIASSFNSLEDGQIKNNFLNTFDNLPINPQHPHLKYAELAYWMSISNFKLPVVDINNPANTIVVKHFGLALSQSKEQLGLTNTMILYTRSSVALSPVAIQLALYIAIKIFLMIVLASILTSTTTSIELTNGLEDLLTPFKILRLPVTEASMMISIAIRFIPSLLDESKRILNAQASRGVDFKNGGFAQKIKSLVALVVPLFSIAFKKAEDLANAMEARSYNPRYARTRYRNFSLRFIDWLLFSILCVFVGFIISLAVSKIYFTPFGMFEATSLFSK
ncbi:energy-coupling factor transporter transmembrane component T family protein [Ureaplasma zalophigenitalium]|uniref:Energy-coupling factor transporter transmembrane protein EcfT n=1 Tax=Ureaplasma zalophigenitalium TaxID=907723 RepID=A0ABT3BP55_9BACT|nr:energy-coupling factor transporter transmembrane component T [Ureaplasma zalophigenitalium]MCV3754012.1 energy-coupling factor transporter transmembrane protein EcfT [Ureaplasma zalophigenitalium]